MLNYSDSDIENLLAGIYGGDITDNELPEDLYFSIADYLKKALYKGFGGGLLDFELGGTKLELLTELRENIYMFSAAKTYQEVKDISSFLIDESGARRSAKQFRDLGREAFSTWNDAWGETERATAIGQGRMAVKWDNIEANAEILPVLVFDTKGNPCPECKPFEGFAAPVHDKVWNWLMPLLHFNCGCTVRQEESDYKLSSKSRYKSVAGMRDDVPDLFQMNPGKDKVVFSDAHPYFDVAKKDKGFAADNFGMPIPDKD